MKSAACVCIISMFPVCCLPVKSAMPSANRCVPYCRKGRIFQKPIWIRCILWVVPEEPAQKLFQSLQGLSKMEEGTTITVAQLKELLKTVQELGLNGVRIINRLFPERLCSLMPGLLAITTVAEYTGVKKICVIKEGIREGFLITNILEGGKQNAAK